MRIKSKNVHNKGLAIGLAVAGGLAMSHQSAEAAPVKASCDVPKAIRTISKKVVSEQNFKHPVLVAKRKDATVKIFEKGSEHQAFGDPFIEDPLVVKCGSRVVRYVGVSMSKDGLGDVRRIDTMAPYKLYMHSIPPEDAVVQVESRDYVSLNVSRDAETVNSTLHYGMRPAERVNNGFMAPGFTNGKSDFGKIL